VGNNPLVVESAIHGLQTIVKAIEADKREHKGDEQKIQLKQQLFQVGKMVIPRLVEIFSYFDSESFQKTNISKFNQAFESIAHQKSFCNKIIISGTTV
jgi:hypothetical protein